MKLYRNVTISFFILLALSIGVMSVNSMTTSVFAQSNTLDQKGNNQASQINEQLQSSNQDDQVVSGDSSVSSGNNLQCQNMGNIKIAIGDLEPNCANGPDNRLISDSKFIRVEIELNFLALDDFIPVEATIYDGGYPVPGRHDVATDSSTIFFTVPVYPSSEYSLAIETFDGFLKLTDASAAEGDITCVPPSANTVRIDSDLTPNYGVIADFIIKVDVVGD